MKMWIYLPPDIINNDIENLELTTFIDHLDEHRDPVTGKNKGI